jgi:hypothetical protein
VTIEIKKFKIKDGESFNVTKKDLEEEEAHQKQEEEVKNSR